MGEANGIGKNMFLEAGGDDIDRTACRLAEQGSGDMPRPPQEDEHVDELFRC